MRQVNFLLCILLILGVVVVSVDGTVSAQDPCNGLVQPRLQTRQTARVMFNDGLGNQLRDNPGRDQSGSNVVGVVSEGTVRRRASISFLPPGKFQLWDSCGEFSIEKYKADSPGNFPEGFPSTIV